MPSPLQSAGPVTLGERIQFIDVLRGIALFGILTANIRAFVAPIDAYGDINVLFPGTADVIAQGVVNWLFQGKFISIFSFLFGLGFAMQFSRAQAKGASFLRFYPRRLAALALFGLIHGVLIWSGDILLTYALAGAILMLFRKCRQPTLLYWAGGLVCLPILVSAVFFCIYFTPLRRPWMVPKLPDLHKLQGVINIYAHGSLRQILVQNWVEWKDELPLTLFAIYAVALFLAGMWVWRANIVQRLPELRPVLRRLCLWCFPVGLTASLFVAVMRAAPPDSSVTFAKWLAGALWLPGAHVLALGYCAALALLFLQPGWRRLMQPFAAVGRMALTNYLAQSVVCTLFFYHTGTGWFGRIGPALAFVPVFLLYGAQLIFSNLWLKHYRFGPMEWLWRGLTYGHFPSIARAREVQEEVLF